MIEDILNRIKSRLDALGLSESEASERAGLSRDAIRNMRRAVGSNRREGVSTRTLTALAPVLETTASWLLEGSFQDPYTTSTGHIPVVGSVQAGVWRELEPFDSDDAHDTIPVLRSPAFHRSRQYALRVEGDSMNRVFSEGQFVIVASLADAGVDLADGDLVICEREKAGLREVTVKRLRKLDGRTALCPESTNPVHQPLFLDGDDGDEIAPTTAFVSGIVIGRYEPMR